MRKRLTYSNVMATIAVFIALGGVSYAATKLPKNSVGAKQIKKNAVTTAKVKNQAITGAKIKLSTLGKVPSAQNADHATSADNSQALQGLSQDQLVALSKLKCPSGMALKGGVCFETTPRAAKSFGLAQLDCAGSGLRLPSAGELIQYESSTSPQPPVEWVGASFQAPTGESAQSLSAASGTIGSGFQLISVSVPYRCVTLASN